jgi:hypothetical protein
MFPDRNKDLTLKYEYWVPEEDRKKFFRFEQSLGIIENDPTCRAAVSTLFWQGYYGFKGKLDRFDNSTLSRLENLFLKVNDQLIEQPSEQALRARSDFNIHLSTILLLAQNEFPSFSPELKDTLFLRGQSALDYFLSNHYLSIMNAAEVSRRDEMLFIVYALFVKEQFKQSNIKQEYEKSLHLFTLAVHLWSQVDSNTNFNMDEPDLQEGADCFEQLFLDTSQVSDWKSIENACEVIKSSLESGPRNWINMAFNHTITDHTGKDYLPIAYWQRAITIAQKEIRPGDLILALRLAQENYHRDRLKIDFLGSLLAVMEGMARRKLISGEIAWYQCSSSGGAPEQVVDNVRQVFEIELKTMVFRNISDSVNRLLSDGEKRKSLGIKSTYVERLSAFEMALLLSEANKQSSLCGLPIRDFLKKTRITQDDRLFLTDKLPFFIFNELNPVRRVVAHGDKDNNMDKLIKSASEIRRKALGIGDRGYLIWLLEIKQKLIDDAILVKKEI